MIRQSIRNGFTLVETLVSLVLFVIIMLMVNSIFFQVLNDSARMASVMSSYDGVRMFGTQITTELGSTMVRVNDERWLNLKVEETEDGSAIFFTAPDDSIRNVKGLNFISHYVYYFDKETHSLYRAVYNTSSEPEVLAGTGADVNNKNRSANQRRLTEMTLAYRSGSPYGWTTSQEMKELMDQEPHKAIVENVFDFEVRCYDRPKSEGGEPTTTWEDTARLPLFVELDLRVADDRLVGALEDQLAASGELTEEWRKKLRRFIITVPMLNHDINDNRRY